MEFRTESGPASAVNSAEPRAAVLPKTVRNSRWPAAFVGGQGQSDIHAAGGVTCIAPPLSAAVLRARRTFDILKSVAVTDTPPPDAAVFPVIVNRRSVTGWKLSSSAMPPPDPVA